MVLYLFIAPLFWSGYGSMSGPIAYLIGAVQFPGIVLMALLLLVSVQWGRGRWSGRRVLRGIRIGVTVLAVLLTPFTLVALSSSLQSLLWDSQSQAASPGYTPGLSVDGQRVRNIFAFDAEGNAIPTVQLFDQDGNPLTTVGREERAVTVRRPLLRRGRAGACALRGARYQRRVEHLPAARDPAGRADVERRGRPREGEADRLPFLRVQPVPTEVAPAPTPTAGSDAAPATPTPTPTAPTP